MEIDFNLRWEINQHNIDPLLFQLLAAIRQEGSLQSATRTVGVSYRFGWGLLTKWQQILGQPLVILERGRGANLSTIGDKLVNANQKLIAGFSPDLDNFATQLRSEIEPLLSQDKVKRLSIFASHGLAINALRDMMQRQAIYQLDVHFHGSLDSLSALEKGQCDIAGFHIPIGNLAKQIASNFLSTISPKQHQLIYVVKRNQGLMVASGNPKDINNIDSLRHNAIRFINRQQGSGTRLLFDQYLAREGIDSSEITGYHNEEFTHMAVAAMVASGMADVGFGIAPMADKFGLEFIPMVWEHYCLAVPLNLMQDDNVQHMLSVLKSMEFQQSLSALPGYESSRAGQEVSFSDIFSNE